MSRCKCCDDVLGEHEIVWKPELNKHEDLCLACRNIIYALENNIALEEDNNMSEEECDG